MRIRIAALLLAITGVACGDPGGPESDLPAGRGSVAVSGDLSGADSMIAGAAFAPTVILGESLTVTPGTSLLIALSPVIPHGPTGTSRAAAFNSVLFPFSIELDLIAASDSVVGSHELGAHVSATVIDSVGLTGTGTVQDSTFAIGVPTFDRLLQGVSGTVVVDRADSAAVMGSFTIATKSKSGRVVNATGRFNAKVLQTPSQLGLPDSLSIGLSRATSPPPPSPSRVRR